VRREELRFSTPCRPRGGCGLWDRRELEEGRGAKDVYSNLCPTLHPYRWTALPWVATFGQPEKV